MGTFFIKFCIATLQEYRERMEIDPVYEGAKVDFFDYPLATFGGVCYKFLKIHTGSSWEFPGDVRYSSKYRFFLRRAVLFVFEQ